MVESNTESGGKMNGVSEGVNGHSDHKVKEHSSSKSSSEKHSSSKHSSHDKHKDRHSHSSSKDKHSSSSHKDKHRDKDRDREHKSGEHRDKDRHDKDRRDKDRHDKDKHRSHGSSKEGHRDKHKSSSHKDKHRDKERSDGHEKTSERSHERSDRDKDSSTMNGNSHELSKTESKVIDESPQIDEPPQKEGYEVGYESEDDVPLTERREINEDPDEDEQMDDVKEENSDEEFKIKEEEVDEYNEEDVKQEEMDEDFEVKEEEEDEEDQDDKPLSARAKKSGRKRKMSDGDDEDDEDFVASKNKTKKEKPKIKKEKKVKEEPITPKKEPKREPITPKKEPKTEPASPLKGKKKKVKEEEPEKWKWWEEERKDDGVKWKFLEHKGPLFAPAYERLPKEVRFLYDGNEMRLSEETEEVATFYGRMLNHDYVTMEVFNNNFFKDWRSVMTESEKKTIKDIAKCDFRQILAHFTLLSEQRKARSKEEKNAEKEKNAAIQEEYGFCTIDGHKEKIGNFRIEPPGLFRGRGSHPKMGMLKKRVHAEQVLINCSKDSEIPEAPPGHHWKGVQHDNTVTWLAAWVENVQDQHKYVMLNPSSKLKGEKDWQKYETARRLKQHVDSIRATYREDWKSKEMRIRQRAVALYFIDKLALRAGNEKDEDSADTVGCCSLRYEHIKLHQELDGKEYVVEFDFLGKDSIRYYNKVAVEKRVFKNLELFLQNKNEGDDIFDRLNTTVLNNHLQTLMDGLTAKVFRTYNASSTLQEQLNILTVEEDALAGKILSYNRANRKVAILCNHQRAVPKNFDKQMENIQAKISAKRDAVKEARKDMKQAKIAFKNHKVETTKKLYEKKKKTVERLEDQLNKLEVSATDKDENKEIALGTSKLNYLDPRISIAWCKKWEVPVEKVYNKTQRDKFAWAIAMADEDYAF